MLVCSNETFTVITTMANDNRCWSMSRQRDYFTKLLTIVCILVACQVSAQITTLVDYEDVLKSRTLQIQSDINQFYDSNSISFLCRHYPLYSGESTNTVIFVWASERETHAMQTCLYREIKIHWINLYQEMEIREITEAHRLEYSTFIEMEETVEFCSRSVNASARIERRNKVIVFNLYFNDPENDGLVVEEALTWYSNSDIPTVTSLINVSPTKNISSHVRRFVCNSIQLTLHKTGRLRQRFFSVVGNSTETIVKSTRNGSASVTLDFDVLSLNASRLGLLNNSSIELLFLSHLQASCIKCDQYGLNNKTNKVELMDTTKELLVTTDAKIIDENLRIYVTVSIPVLSDHSFGEYSCSTYCELRTYNSNHTIDGCIQQKYFSIVFHKWRYENLYLRRELKVYENNIENIDNSNKQYRETADKSIRTVKQCLDFVNGELNKMGKARNKWEDLHTKMTKYTNDIIKPFISQVDSLKNEQFFLYLFLKVLVAVIVMYIAYRIAYYIHREVKARSYQKTFMSVESVLQSTEKTDDRIMKYDVFLSYSSKDRPWVESTLLKFIESKGFKVCFDERDFPLGCNLVQTIGTAVYESRKVIAVVSPNYLQSRWCAQYEFVLTYTKILNKEAPLNSLLLIKYRDCQMPEHMRCLKYLDYTKSITTAFDDNRSFAMKVLSYILSFYKEIVVHDTSSEKAFFDSLSSWLGKQHNTNYPEHRGRKKHKNYGARNTKKSW